MPGALCVWMHPMKIRSGAISGTSSFTRARTLSTNGCHTVTLSIDPMSTCSPPCFMASATNFSLLWKGLFVSARRW